MQERVDGQTIFLPNLGSQIETAEKLEIKYGESTDELCNDHEALIE